MTNDYFHNFIFCYVLLIIIVVLVFAIAFPLLPLNPFMPAALKILCYMCISKYLLQNTLLYVYISDRRKEHPIGKLGKNHERFIQNLVYTSSIFFI